MSGNLHRKRSHGFSLVEVMVAMVIGLLAMIVVLQVFSLSEGSKRTSTSGGDAQQSGSMALFSIERDLRQAGYGMTALPAFGCTINGWDNGPPSRSITSMALQLAPVVIKQGASNGPDEVIVSYGNNGVMTPVTTLTQNNNGTNANYQVVSNYGFQTVGDLILVVEPGNPACTLAEVNGVPPSLGNPLIIHNSGAGNPRYNKPSGIGISHAAGSMVVNLGPLPIVNDYTVTLPSAAAPSGQLNVQNSLTAAAPVPIVDSIINLQAEYGMDDGANPVANTVTHASYTADDKVIDNWTTTTPANTTDWRRVIAVRLAIVARSGLREKPNAAGQCTATAGTPTWAGSATSPLVFNDDADGTSWRCYRYKIYETTVPLRNMLW